MVSMMKNESEIDRFRVESEGRVSMDMVSSIESSKGSDGFRVSAERNVEGSSSRDGKKSVSVFEFVEPDEVVGGKKEVRVSKEVDGRGFGIKKESKSGVRGEGEDRVGLGKLNGSVSDFASAYSKVDEGAAVRRLEAFGSEASKALSYGFEPGDMVWGKVKSHPWWPGHVFSEAFATPSVRRSKRPGHLLVAFFGDSSYGWFDPAELIPFGPNYAEKSRQTPSRSFVKAVEEAVDEASRRAALGSTCKCRNPYNFRPTNVKGYFAIDVTGYEPGGVYSVMQIKKARESFHPSEALGFVQQLALNPQCCERKSIESIQNKAKILAFRKAVYEEFDETYAEAFGMTPVRPSDNPAAVLDQASKFPVKAPLSGPMVTAETLGGKKSSTKSSKGKDPSKKDKYLLKRRDDLNEFRSSHVTKDRTDISPPFKEVTAATPTEYVFQKRASVVPERSQPSAKQGIGTYSGDAPLIQSGPVQETESAGKKSIAVDFDFVDTAVDSSSPPGFSAVSFDSFPVMEGGPEDGKLRLDNEKILKLNRRMIAGGDQGSSVTGGVDVAFGKSEIPSVSDISDHVPQDTALADSQQGAAKRSNDAEGFEPPKQGSTVPVKDHRAPNSEFVATSALPIDAQLRGTVPSTSVENRVKKTKVHKYTSEDQNLERSFSVEKKKKSKKELRLDSISEHPKKRHKISKDGETPRKSAGKSIGISLAPTEKTQLVPQRKEEDVSSSTIQPSDSAVPPPNADLGNVEADLPDLLHDLMALALDPFHGIERNGPEIARQCFLRFRSVVYSKSLVLPTTETEPSEEVFAQKSPPPGDGVRDPVSKHPKSLFRPEDPTKSGRKRSLSGRQEEMSAKRVKKITELKLMTAEKKGGSRKNQEVQQREQREIITSVPAATTRPDSSVRKPEPPPRVADPVMLVMKFPPRMSLPSIAELKARFARFGPLDYNAMRVFWKTSTCRVVFKHRLHGQAAYNHAIQNRNFFGNVNVTYYLRDHGVPAPEVAPEMESPLSKGDSRPSLLGQWTPQPSSQLKSCLKKPSDEGGGAAPAREIPRVKFMLGGEESSSRGEQSMMVNVSKDSNKNGNGGAVSVGGASSSSSSSSLAMDVNTKNFQKVIPPPPPSVILPLPPPPPPPSRNMDVMMHENRGMPHFVRPQHALPPPPPPPPYYSQAVGERLEQQPPINYRNHNMFNSIPTTTSNTNTNTKTSNNNNNNGGGGGIDISHQMLTLLVRCNDIVSDVNRLLGYVPYHPL